jgi:hypothetical protein
MTTQIMTKMVLNTWHSTVKDADALIDQLADEQLQKEIAPNRNRGIYLLGHLAAVHDRILPLLNFGEQLYPQLADPFINNPDKAQVQSFQAQDLRKYWKNINSKLSDHFNSLPPDEWFQKHNSVSAENFTKEPHRNKLNVVISRTNHLSYHLGQLALLKS